MNDAVEIAKEAAIAAARLIAEAKRPQRVDHKGSVDLVTEVDCAAEEAIIHVLARRTPQIPILAEEGGGAQLATTRWIVDPLDGTTNFVHGFPCYGPSVALQLDGEIVAACTIDVPRQAHYWASQGGGSWCNEERLSVSGIRTLTEALLVTGFPYDRRTNADMYLRFVRAFMVHSQGLRRDGAAAIDFAHIASGRADGFWEFGLQPWDVAAGTLLIQEAGGRTGAIDGGMLDLGRPHIVASNGWIQDEMTQICASILDQCGDEWDWR